MPKHYVTFGQVHRHNIQSKRLNADCVARFEAENPYEGRAKAFALFGPKFCFEYHDTAFPQDSMKYYPRGFVDLEAPDLTVEKEDDQNDAWNPC